jgi:hypothetical protein
MFGAKRRCPHLPGVSIFSAASHRVSRKPGNCPGENSCTLLHLRYTGHVASDVPNELPNECCRISNLWRLAHEEIVQISSNYLLPGKNYQVASQARAVSQLAQTEVTGLFVVFSQGKPHLAIFFSPRNCQTALVAHARQGRAKERLKAVCDCLVLGHCGGNGLLR